MVRGQRSCKDSLSIRHIGDGRSCARSQVVDESLDLFLLESDAGASGIVKEQDEFQIARGALVPLPFRDCGVFASHLQRQTLNVEVRMCLTSGIGENRHHRSPMIALDVCKRRRCRQQRCQRHRNCHSHILHTTPSLRGVCAAHSEPSIQCISPLCGVKHGMKGIVAVRNPARATRGQPGPSPGPSFPALAQPLPIEQLRGIATGKFTIELLHLC